MAARKHQFKWELLSTTATREMAAGENQSKRELLSTTAAREMVAGEHQSERELLSTTAAESNSPSENSSAWWLRGRGRSNRGKRATVQVGEPQHGGQGAKGEAGGGERATV
jgi:hypothetical protein